MRNNLEGMHVQYFTCMPVRNARIPCKTHNPPTVLSGRNVIAQLALCQLIHIHLVLRKHCLRLVSIGWHKEWHFWSCTILKGITGHMDN